MKTIGIIAGNGRFPILSAHKARNEGYRVVVCGMEREADPILRGLAHAFKWVKIGQLKKMRDFFWKENVREAIMAGKIEKTRIFQENVRPDLDMVKVLMKTRNFKDDSLLAGIAGYLHQEGIELLDSTLFSKDLMPGPGILGKHKPSREVREDIEFGFEIAKQVAGLDIGQTVVVKKRAVLAVEAIEGTDLAISRGAELGKEKIVVVKVAKPNQDMRFDVPAVGLRTLEALACAKACALGFEADKTLLIDREEVIQAANRHRIALVACSEKHS